MHNCIFTETECITKKAGCVYPALTIHFSVNVYSSFPVSCSFASFDIYEGLSMF